MRTSFVRCEVRFMSDSEGAFLSMVVVVASIRVTFFVVLAFFNALFEVFVLPNGAEDREDNDGAEVRVERVGDVA